MLPRPESGGRLMAKEKSQPTPDELSFARSLVLKHGWNAAAYQILNPGISLWFSKARDAVAGYSDWGGVRVVAGAPVCAQERLVEVAEELEGDTVTKGLRCCYFGAGPRLEENLSHGRGYVRVLLGSQPPWNPADWPAILAKLPSLRAQL